MDKLPDISKSPLTSTGGSSTPEKVSQGRDTTGHTVSQAEKDSIAVTPQTVKENAEHRASIVAHHITAQKPSIPTESSVKPPKTGEEALEQFLKVSPQLDSLKDVVLYTTLLDVRKYKDFTGIYKNYFARKHLEDLEAFQAWPESLYANILGILTTLIQRFESNQSIPDEDKIGIKIAQSINQIAANRVIAAFQNYTFTEKDLENPNLKKMAKAVEAQKLLQDFFDKHLYEGLEAGNLVFHGGVASGISGSINVMMNGADVFHTSIIIGDQSKRDIRELDMWQTIRTVKPTMDLWQLSVVIKRNHQTLLTPGGKILCDYLQRTSEDLEKERSRLVNEVYKELENDPTILGKENDGDLQLIAALVPTKTDPKVHMKKMPEGNMVCSQLTRYIIERADYLLQQKLVSDVLIKMEKEGSIPKEVQDVIAPPKQKGPATYQEFRVLKPILRKWDWATPGMILNNILKGEESSWSIVEPAPIIKALFDIEDLSSIKGAAIPKSMSKKSKL